MSLFGSSRASTLIVAAFVGLVLVGVAQAQVGTPATGSREARELGIQEAKAGHYVEGYGHLLLWLRANPEDHEARFHASWCAAFLGRTYEAAELLFGLDEDEPRVQYLWGKLLLDKRDPQGAVELLEPLSRTAPPELDLEIRRLLAKAWMAVGRADRAVLLLEGRVGEDPALVLELALAKYEAGDLRGASELLSPNAQAALTRYRGDPSAQVDALSIGLIYEYGRILVTTARHSEAVPYLEASVQLVPDCRQCWQHLAQAYAASGRREKAQSAQRRFQEILQSEVSAEDKQRQEAMDQQDPTGRVLREASEEFRTGRADEALAMLRQESSLSPEDPRTMYLAAQILVEVGRPEQALGLAESAVQLAPDLADGYFVRGTVLAALGRPADARRDFARALELDPAHAQAAEGLGRLAPS